MLSFASLTDAAEFPNVIVPRQQTGEVIGHSFQPFPPGDDLLVNYNGGEVRTVVGNFLGNGMNQIAAAQGMVGMGLFVCTSLRATRTQWLAGSGAVFRPVAGAMAGNANGGITLGAGDVDNDGKDELLVGQTNSPTSETIFHLLDINEEGNVESRIAYAGFTPRFRGDGGVNLHVCDLNGDGKKEILVASMGNSGNHGDDRDSAPRNLMGIIIPIITNAQVTGFQRAARGVFNVFTEEDNPSGGFSITAGELNGNTEDGDELVVGTSAMYDIDGFSITPAWLRQSPVTGL